MRMSRAEVLDPAEVQTVHVYNRTVRRCFLMGRDPVSGKNFDHRKVWIEASLPHFAAAFGIDLLGFAILSNHFHLVLRSRPDVVAQWDDREVARRWLVLCPQRKDPQGNPLPPSEIEINQIANCPLRRDVIRKRLSNISWWMRLLCQRIASRANREEGETGHFFQGRFRSTLLTDEASLLACSVYVDLNPVRAGVCQKIEDSDHTSIQRRIESAQQQNDPAFESVRPPVKRLKTDDFLAPLSIDEANDPVGPCESTKSSRCSDKGYLPMSLEDYCELLDWTARQSVQDKRGVTPQEVPPVLSRLGLDASSWCELSSGFGKLFSLVAGHPRCVDAMRSHRTHRRFHLRRRARELFASR